MPDAIITSTASTFGTISGTFAADQSTITGTVSGIVPGTLSGSVGVPGPAGSPGAPGVGVPVGGTAGQYLQKIDGVDYNTDWVTLNLSGYALLSGADFTGRVTFPGIISDGFVSFSGVSINTTPADPTDKVDGDLWIYDDEGDSPSKFKVYLEGNTQNIATESYVGTNFATKISPVFTGDPRAPTPPSGDNDTSIATTAFVKAQGYAPLASPAFTGNPTAPTAALADNDTSIATTAFVQQELLSGTANARNLEVYVRNQTGSTIPAGAIVYINGATGNRPTITLAQANNDANSAQTFGFTKAAIANNGFGFVIVRGECEALDTSALTEGVQLYLSPTTAGAYTTTKPSAPQHLVYVGICVRAHPTLGVILVAVQNGYELPELHDVKITSPTNGQVLKYDSAQSLWVNGTDSAPVTSVAGRTGAITLSNTDISGLGTMATATATDYLSKAGNLSGLASTSTARTNLGLGTISTFNDAPSDGSQYARKNGAWDVVSGGGASLPAVQIAASAINPAKLTFVPSPQCIALTYPSHTDVLNGLYATSFTYSNDASGTPSLILSDLTSLTSATFLNNAAMTTAPDLSGLTSLLAVYVTNCDALTSPPDFTGLTGLTTVEIAGNDALTSPPDFTDCTGLNNATVQNNAAMTTAPDFTGLTSLSSVNVSNNDAMTSPPDFTDCSGLSIATVSNNAAMTTPPDFTDCTTLLSVNVSFNDAMTSPPDFSALASLDNATVSNNGDMTTAPDFTGLTSLTLVYVQNNAAMTTAPDFTGCTSLAEVTVTGNAAMTAAPDFTDCSALTLVSVIDCAITDTNLLTMCSQIYTAGAASGSLAMEGGTNGSFDGQSLPTEITDLQGNGWTVTFNDNNPP